MIKTRKDLKDCLQADALASGRSSTRPALLGDEIWKFQISLRTLEYYGQAHSVNRLLCLPAQAVHRIRYHRLSVKLGYSIPLNVFGSGLSIPHRGTIVVAKSTRAGKNCRIHEGVTIGATNGSSIAAVLGDNVFLGAGAKIIGAVEIADDVASPARRGAASQRGRSASIPHAPIWIADFPFEGRRHEKDPYCE